VRSGGDGGLGTITRRLKVRLEVGSGGVVEIFRVQMMRVERLCGDLGSLDVLGILGVLSLVLVLARVPKLSLVILRLLGGRFVVLGLGRHSGRNPSVKGSRRSRRSRRLMGSGPWFIVDSLVKYLLDSTHVELISDTASWAGPERRLMIIRPLVRFW